MTASPSDPTSTSTPRFAFVRGDEIAPQALHAAFTAAFSDYLIGPFQIPPAQWPMFLARQGVDLALSRVALDPAGAALAFAFVAPRPLAGRWRLATMGALPAARGTGAAPALLDDFIARAAAAGLRAVELEVFAQNERARRLYEGRGFTARRCSRPADAAPHAVEMPVALAWLEAAEQCLPELPLQVTAATLRHGVDYHAWQVGASGEGDAPDGDAAAQVVFSLPDETVMVHSLVAPREADARALVQALVAVHPQRRLRVPQLQRDDLGGAALRALGAVPQPLHQQWMLRPL